MGSGTRLRQGNPLQAQAGISRPRLRFHGVGEDGVGCKGARPMSLRRMGLFRDIEVSVGLASGPEAAHLAVDQSVQVFRIQRLRLFQGRPFMLEQSCLPASLFPDLETRVGPPYQVCDVAAAYGIALARAEERTLEIVADEAVAERLEVAEGSPVLLLDRVVYSEDGNPIEWRVARCRLRDRSPDTGVR
jgi:GntR family transcriptional regulator